MAINRKLIQQAIESIAEVEGVSMSATSLVEDVFLLAHASPEEEDFMAACASTCRALKNLVEGRVTSSKLKYDLEDWKSYHYQHRVNQGAKATCRIMYRLVAEGIEVKGFGHRRIPGDFYERMSDLRNEGQEPSKASESSALPN